MINSNEQFDLEPLKPVIVALDVETRGQAKSVVEAIGDYKDQVALQIRSSMLATAGLEFPRELSAEGWQLIHGARHTDTNGKLAGDIRAYALNFGQPWDGFTIEPPKKIIEEEDDQGLRALKEAIGIANLAGIRVIGVPNLEAVHLTDKEHIADESLLYLETVEKLRIGSLEVLCAGLEDFAKKLKVARQLDLRQLGVDIVVSKLGQRYNPDGSNELTTEAVAASAKDAFRLGATSVLIGGIVYRQVDKAGVIEAVLESTLVAHSEVVG